VAAAESLTRANYHSDVAPSFGTFHWIHLPILPQSTGISLREGEIGHQEQTPARGQKEGMALKTVGLVSCTKSKKKEPSLARELYMPSSLFQKERAYCERTYDEWYILSAKHGLLHPATLIDPYDVTLNRMRAKERRAWGARVWEQLQSLLPAELYFHGGARYREPLIPYLKDSSHHRTHERECADGRST